MGPTFSDYYNAILRIRKLRGKAGTKTALEIPEVKKCIEDLPNDFSGKASRWLGKINQINVDSIIERKHLIKHAVLAFEFYHWNKNLDNLESIRDENIESVISLFRESDALEATLYGQIVHQRIAVIRALQKKVSQNDRERAIQEYIFDHLWLLDPSWERAEASEHMETRIGTLFSNVNSNLTPEEKNARLDIKYRKTAGKHVIVELKRPDRPVSVHDLTKQIGKYRGGMLEILERVGTPNEPVEFVCLLGKPPTEWSQKDGKKMVEDMLKAVNARYVNYDELLENAFRSYSDYLKRASLLDRLGEVIRAIDNYAQAGEEIDDMKPVTESQRR